MRKKSAVLAGCAAASSFLVFAAVSRGALSPVLIENFGSAAQFVGGYFQERAIERCVLE